MERLSPLKSIRKHCIECSGGSSNEVKLCPITRCALYSYRFGKTGRKSNMTDEQKKAATERLMKTRNKEDK